MFGRLRRCGTELITTRDTSDGRGKTRRATVQRRGLISIKRLPGVQSIVSIVLWRYKKQQYSGGMGAVNFSMSRSMWRPAARRSMASPDDGVAAQHTVHGRASIGRSHVAGFFFS